MEVVNTLLPYIVPILVGGALFLLSRVGLWVYHAVIYHVTVTLEISTDHQAQWNWLQYYMIEHVRKDLHHWVPLQSTEIEASYSPTAIRLPFEGHMIRIKIADATSTDRMVLVQGHQSTSQRRVATLWTRQVDDAYFRRFLQRIKDEYLKKHETSVTYSTAMYYSHNNDAGWQQTALIQRRPLSTLTLDDAQVQHVLNMIRHFLSAKGRAFHAKHGIPYHLGLLLEGPPGNGKSSFILALASQLGANVRRLVLKTSYMDDSILGCLMKGSHTDDPPCIIVLEDIDCLTDSRTSDETSTSKEGTSRVTLSGLLNALDGLGAPENAIIVMTTNHAERLDPALIRPGRVDYRMRFENPDDTRIARHYVKYYPEETETSINTLAFVKQCRDLGKDMCSMAFVQGQIMYSIDMSKE